MTSKERRRARRIAVITGDFVAWQARRFSRYADAFSEMTAHDAQLKFVDIVADGVREGLHKQHEANQ